MIATPGGRQKKLQRHRLIERPRLINLLEGSKARALIFVAPAGFGKTTLADQWIVSGGRSGAWFRARPSSTDVAGLALDVARAASTIVPGCDERLREHLRAVPAPGDNVDTLAEIVAEDLHSWPSTAWLVIDEYQEISGAKDAERFVESLFDLSRAQFVIASRRQPSWATQRRILHGELFELGQVDLVMGAAEAAEVLADRDESSGVGLITLANGWPAAIGLASVSQAEVGKPTLTGEEDQIRESLYRYFAEEIFASFDSSVQDGLVTLSVAPVIDRQLASDILGAERASAVCETGIGVGIIVDRAGQLELHPLARAFLHERAAVEATKARSTAQTCMTHYLVQRDWDAALELIERFGFTEGFHTALREGLDELLETARISTVEAWCDAGERLNVDSPYIALARAEIALRRARFTEAQTHAEAAAFPDSHARYRGLCLAGRAAHMASREEEAAELYRQAEAAATTEKERREARWCEVVCLIDMEDPHAADLYSALHGSKVRSDPSDLVRSAVTGLAYQLKFGPLDLIEADGAYELLRATHNSTIQTSFLSMYGVTLAASARYDEARAVAHLLIEIAQRLRLEFATPFARATAAAAEAGCRRWDLAQAHIDLALESARNNKNVYAEQVSVATAIRLLIQQGRYDDALSLPVPAHHSSLPAGTAEVLASRALALAAASRIDEVPALLAEAERLSGAMEPRYLASAARAVAALKSGASALDRVHDVAAHCLDGGTLDILVTAYRSAPALLQVLLKDAEYGERVARVVARVGDQDLADAVGQPLSLDDPRARLSKRELEVLAMLEQGLSNRQIAQTLVISEKTAKVHVHRIYDKLGVRSRRDIAVQALLRRTDHATSAMGGTDGSAGSSLL